MTPVSTTLMADAVWPALCVCVCEGFGEYKNSPQENLFLKPF